MSTIRLKKSHLFLLAALPVSIGIVLPIVLISKYGVEEARHVWLWLFIALLILSMAALNLLYRYLRFQFQMTSKTAASSKGIMLSLTLLIGGGLLAIWGKVLSGLCTVAAGFCLLQGVLRRQRKR